MNSRHPVRHAAWFALAVGACAAGGSVGCSHKAVEEAPPPPAPKVHVETAKVGEQSVPKILRLTGSLSSNERTDLAANASGRVTRTFVERGDHVQQGALLAQLDARAAVLSQNEAAANAASAAEQLKNLQIDCQRYTNLLAKGAITQQEYDNKATSCRTQAASEAAAQARVAQAGQTLNDSAIRAPFAGLIAERFVHVGDYVHADTRVVTLLVDDPLRLELTVPEANVASIHPGLVVSFQTVAVPGRVFQATVRFMGGEIREATRDLVVEAITDNHDRSLLPGMFVNVDVPVGEVTLPVVPSGALLHHDENTTLFVSANGHLEERIVQLGAQVGDMVAVSDGVKRGEDVVVKPPANAADGMDVD
jgi:RND family efflux transporter MFP subunit